MMDTSPSKRLVVKKLDFGKGTAELESDHLAAYFY